MPPQQIEAVCENVSASVAEVTAVFRTSLPIPEILNRFWALQDNLCRLLEAIKDYPAQTMDVMERYPRLLNEIAGLLEDSANMESLRKLAAVRESAGSMHTCLLEIHRTRQARPMTASA